MILTRSCSTTRFVPDLHLIGEVDMAWKQATDELAYERSGPDRWLETFPALVELVRGAGEEPSERLAEGIGREVAHLATLRRMSCRSPACCKPARRRRSKPPSSRISAPIGSRPCPTRCACWRRRPAIREPDSNDDRFEEALRHTTLIAPKLTIQGGTREVLRGIIARGLGLR